jgi:peroxiredoxin
VGALVVGFIVMSALQAPPVQVDPNAQVPADAKHVAAGAAAPNFSLPALDGKTYSLADQKGKVVVLEFMATWCPHCQDDAPMMNQLDAAYKDKGVQILGINATPRGHDNESPAKMDDLKWFKDNYGVTFPLLFDQPLQSAKDYGVTGYPTIYVIDQQGNVSMPPSETSLPTYTDLSGAIDKLLTK